MVCVRENSEGEYAGVGGGCTSARRTKWRSRPASSPATGSSAFSATRSKWPPRGRGGCWPAPPSRTRCSHSMVLWDEVAEFVRADYPSVDYRKYHVDALAARMVTHPGRSTSSSRRTCSATSSPTSARRSPAASASRRAPTSTRRGLAVDVRADPRVGARHRGQGHRQPDRRDLGRRADARSSRPSRRPRPDRLGAIERVVRSGRVRTPDLGGAASTEEVAHAIVAEI